MLYVTDILELVIYCFYDRAFSKQYFVLMVINTFFKLLWIPVTRCNQSSISFVARFFDISFFRIQISKYLVQYIPFLWRFPVVQNEMQFKTVQPARGGPSRCCYSFKNLVKHRELSKCRWVRPLPSSFSLVDTELSNTSTFFMSKNIWSSSSPIRFPATGLRNWCNPICCHMYYLWKPTAWAVASVYRFSIPLV